jgi:hypothetical protein
LAELARLIGQNDPFGEFGRDNTRRASVPPAHEPPPSWADEPQSLTPPQPAAAPQAAPAENYFTAPQPPPNFSRQPFGGAPLGHDTDMYQVETTVPGYAQQPAPGFETHDAYTQGAPHLGPEEDDFYEDEQPSRRRMGILVIAGVFALAVIGTAGAFGYRALFGSSFVSGPPPVIKADTAPSKIVPPAAKDTQSSKQITDRINDKGLGEKLVSREEQPVPIAPQDSAPPASPPQSSMPLPPAGQGTGVVGTEPKKVRTIAIRPDQGAPEQAAPPPAAPPATASAPARVIPTAKPAQPPARAASNSLAPATADAEPEPAPRHAAPRAQAQTAQAAAPRPANAPLSLSPDAGPAPRAPARAATPAAAPAPRAAAAPAPSGGGSYLVQVSSQRSEAEAQSAFASLQSKYPGQLGGKQPVIRKVELGDKGTFYRAMVPAGSSAEATELCSGMKAAGGSCLIQKN